LLIIGVDKCQIRPTAIINNQQPIFNSQPETVNDHQLIIPLDHPDVVQPRAADFVYSSLVNLLDAQMEKMTATVEQLRPWMDSEPMNRIPAERVNDIEPYWNNGYFSGDDARIAYALVRARKPAAIVEIGSGNSTKFFRRAISESRTKSTLVSIDPAPRAEI